MFLSRFSEVVEFLVILIVEKIQENERCTLTPGPVLHMLNARKPIVII